MVAPARDPAQAKGFIAPPGYRRHRPEATVLYGFVAEHYPRFRDQRAAEGKPLPGYVEEEFQAYLKCGRLEHGFLRVRCESCRAEKLVAFSCKRRSFCPSCGGRRMAETAALLVDEVLPKVPVRHVYRRDLDGRVPFVPLPARARISLRLWSGRSPSALAAGSSGPA